jgi:hypothetical protein
LWDLVHRSRLIRASVAAYFPGLTRAHRFYLVRVATSPANAEGGFQVVVATLDRENDPLAGGPLERVLAAATCAATSTPSDTSESSGIPDASDDLARLGRICEPRYQVEGLVQANWVEVESSSAHRKAP